MVEHGKDWGDCCLELYNSKPCINCLIRHTCIYLCEEGRKIMNAIMIKHLKKIDDIYIPRSK